MENAVTIDYIYRFRQTRNGHEIKPLRDPDGKKVYIMKKGKVVDTTGPVTAFDPVLNKKVVCK